MRSRLFKVNRAMLSAMCLLTLSGGMYSCSDDYPLPNTKPSFLGGSILDELKSKGDFTYEVRLIEDLNYADVLSKTGSKTLFVAKDSAFESFFKNNPWGVTRYEDLSTSQKRYLFATSMLDNAYVLEMLPNLAGGVKNEALRRVTSAAVTDTVPYMNWSDLPQNLNEDYSTSSYEMRYWDRFRNQATGGIYLAADATTPMMTHFIDGFLRKNSITRSDVAFILNDANGWGDTDADRNYIYNRVVKEGDITCLNGYYNVLDGVMLTPPNMAEAIRQNSTTQLFSQMLDRFSAPYYNASLTTAYGVLHDIGNDSIFEKRYIASRSKGNAAITTYPAYGGATAQVIPTAFPYLTFDPGWNTYQGSGGTTAAQDMAAMFVPTDDALSEYFVSGGGQYLLESYATLPNTRENLSHNLYQIPLNVVRSLINNLMKDSFVETVPSKYATITNDAQDRMFSATNFPTVDALKAAIDTCILANNGVVYVMNSVISPADYAAVSGPVITSDSTKVMAAVIQADENFIDGTNYSNAPLKQYFTTYLKAMQSNFSFFVPTDTVLNSYGYVDPIDYAKNVGTAGSLVRYWRFRYQPLSNSNTSGAIPIRMQAYQYTLENERVPSSDAIVLADVSTNLQPVNGTGAGWAMMKKNLLIEMVNQHIIVHDNDALSSSNAHKYYLSRSGAPIYIKNNVTTNNGKGMVVNGGFQIEENSNSVSTDDNDVNVTLGYDMTSGYGNGMTYFVDRPMQPAMRSVYNILSTDSEFSEFYKLCRVENYSSTLIDLENNPMTTEALLDSAGLLKSYTTTALRNSAIRRYFIFDESGERVGQGAAASPDKLVRFFNNYRYTLFAPSNAGVQDAIANGLPTWETIYQYMFANIFGKAKDATREGHEAKAQAMITALNNFIRYHFMDNTVFVDNVTDNSVYQSSCYMQPIGSTGYYANLTVNQSNGAISVNDLAGRTVNVDASKANIFARDMVLSAQLSNRYAYVTNSSYAAIHKLNGYLNFLAGSNGSFAKPYSSVSEAKKYVKEFGIKK